MGSVKCNKTECQVFRQAAEGSQAAAVAVNARQWGVLVVLQQCGDVSVPLASNWSVRAPLSHAVDDKARFA